MKKILFSLVALTMGTSAMAALSPYYQRLAEVKGILEAADLEAIVSDAKVTASSKVVDGVEFVAGLRNGVSYKVVTGKCTLDVNVEYLPPPAKPWAGPQEFKVNLDKQLNCRRLRP
jgi:hypothetical protein